MAEDVFGCVSSLFEEFERKRESTGTFIAYDRKVDGEEDKSKIVFTFGSSDGESSDDEGESETESHVQKDPSSENDSSFIIPEDMFNESIVKNENMNKPMETNFKLTHERNKFQRFANLIDSTRYVPDEESPGCQILFQNNRFSRKYRHAIEKFIVDLMTKDARDQQRLTDLNLRASSLTSLDINGKLDSEFRTSDMWNAHAFIGAAQYHRECMVDTLGCPLVGGDPSLTDGWIIPYYEQVFLDPIPVDLTEKPSKPVRPKQTCFNCGGEHRINECKEPKNFQKIRENKMKFMEQKDQSQLQKQGSQRYHEDEDIDRRFSAFRPGTISSRLRRALDLSEDQLPPHIYRMRILGYPPGWLEEAKLSASGISVFDKHGNEVTVTEECMEDGEIKECIPNDGQINAEKIIEYPGFTVATPKGVIDEHEELGFPPLQEHQLKSTLKAQLDAVVEMKRKALEEQVEIERKRRKINSTEDNMDIDDDESFTNGHEFIPPMPIDTPPLRPPLPEGTPPPTPPVPKLSLPKVYRNISKDEISEGSSSPSLEDLENQYKILQEKLAANEDVDLQVVDSCGGSDDESESNKEVMELLALKEKLLKRTDSVSSIQTFGELGTGSPIGSAPATPILTPSSSVANLNSLISLQKNKSISKEFGTPILVEAKESLPDSSKFGEGICDHIPYENLPDATGTFDKIRGLLTKIKSFKKKNK